MLQVKVCVVPLYVVMISLFSERNVIDLIGVIKVEAFISQGENYIVESVRSNMEIAWNSVNLNIAGELAALLGFKLLSGSVSDFRPRLLFVMG